PVAGGRIVAHNESLGIIDFRGPSAVTGEDGTFTLKSLAAATYALLATADGYAGTSTHVAFDGTALHTDLRIAVGGALVIRAVDTAGRPVPEVRVTFDATPPSSAPLSPITTDQNGIATYAHAVAGAY